MSSDIEVKETGDGRVATAPLEIEFDVPDDDMDLQEALISIVNATNTLINIHSGGKGAQLAFPDNEENQTDDSVEVKIAVAVDPEGYWNATGWRDADAAAMDLAVETVEEGEARYYVTARLPIPDVKTIEGTVTEDAKT